MIKLDDLLNEVKAPPEALDLANTEIKTKEDFVSAFSKIPEYKIRSEQITLDEMTGEGERGWRGRSTDPHVGEYSDPLPSSMKGLVMDEFYQVNIDWRMLTTARPSNKLEEEIFSRYVELGRAQLERIRDQSAKKSTDTERITKVIPGRGSLPEVRIPTCKNCGEELCTGVCQDYMYDRYVRTQPEKKMPQGEGGGSEGEDDAKKKQKKKTKKRRKKKKNEDQRETGDEADDERD